MRVLDTHYLIICFSGDAHGETCHSGRVGPVLAQNKLRYLIINNGLYQLLLFFVIDRNRLPTYAEKSEGLTVVGVPR